MLLFRFHCNLRLPASIWILVLTFLININIQFCKGSIASDFSSPLQTPRAKIVKRQTGRISTPEECARSCRDGEQPKQCFYRFYLEFYTSSNFACSLCDTPTNYTRVSRINCDCIIKDGFEKTVFSINRMIPGPSIQVCKNDMIIVELHNEAEGIEATLHWHGIFQNGYQYYDGVPYVTQCPILSANYFRYQFAANNSGTHFYHSHVSTHMVDGQYGSLIVRDPPGLDPHYNKYDRDLPEHVIVLSDMFHEVSMARFPGRYWWDRGQVPDNILINGRGNWVNPSNGQSTNVAYSTFMVQRGGRYRFRMINSFSTICSIQIAIERHAMQIIATDGENVQPITVDGIIMATGERVDFILNANQDVRSYWIHVRGLGECQERRIYQLARIIYQGGSQSTQAPGYDIGALSRVFAPLNATNCGNDLCVHQLRKIYNQYDDQVPLRDTADREIVMFFDFYNYSMTPRVDALFNRRDNEYKRFYVSPTGSHLNSVMNNISYGNPQGPLISQNDGYSYLCRDGDSGLSRCTEPCICGHVYDIPLGAIVDVMIYDRRPLSDLYHPFHLHGYSFCVLYAGQFNNARNKDLISSQDVNNELQAHRNRVRNGAYTYCAPKDTVVVPNTGYVILRFEANNPGWWFFHCHITWHTVTGMNVIFHVGQPYHLPPVPTDFPECYNWAPPNKDLP